MGKRPKKRLATGGRRKFARLEAELAGLPEEEKRRRLLELLQADVCGSADDDRHDEEWTMPDLDVEGRTASAGLAMQLDFRAFQVELSQGAVEQLIKACRLVFALDGSSWLPCSSTPRCLAERLAFAIFKHHTAGATFDESRSGAEWWAQVRQPGHEEEAIQFHWDTDESAVESRGVNVHPHLSTVTYLTDHGAPTLVLERRNALRPDEVEKIYGDVDRGLLSRPHTGKHIVFDGQLLHGTVPDPKGEGPQGAQRVTFLVNIWLNHRPSHCRPVPDGLAQRLGDEESGLNLSARKLQHADVAERAGAVQEGDPDPESHQAADSYSFEATFGRTKPHRHQLRVRIPRVSEGGTALLAFAPGTAEVRAASHSEEEIVYG